MAFIQEANHHAPLSDYAALPGLQGSIEALRADAARLAPGLAGRTIWMINSAARGGGVAELLPPQIALLRELGFDLRWIVIEADGSAFFELTKRLHNMIHGAAATLSAADRDLYEAVSHANAEFVTSVVKPEDILIVHDPQPLMVGDLVRQAAAVPTIWRCHIGIDEPSVHADEAWEFLRPYTGRYARAVFSLPQYAPAYLGDRAVVIHPTIDPLSDKNRDLSADTISELLAEANVANTGPIILQVSRWDSLKGFGPLLTAFAGIKRKRSAPGSIEPGHRLRIDNVRLILAGPDARSVQDDPEAVEVLDALQRQLDALPAAVRHAVTILSLPMDSLAHNAEMVNSLQRSADIVAQNSLREGFGLTVAEAMWKAKPVLGSARGAGIRLQVRDGVDGRLVEDPEDAQGLGAVMCDMLKDPVRLKEWGRNAKERVHSEFLIIGELRQWLRLLSETV